jgi:hypothetical protein
MDTKQDPKTLSRRLIEAAIPVSRALDGLPPTSVQARERVMEAGSEAVAAILSEAWPDSFTP